MRKVVFFMLTSLDGFFEGPDKDINWHRGVDEEFNNFAVEQINAGDTLLFGRITYELMASYWPTPAALADDPVVAEKMNTIPKIVFSKTLSGVDWQNTRLVKENVADEISKLKAQPGKDMIVLGSSDLAVAFIEHGLLDEIRVMVNPIVLGSGKTLFQGIRHQLDLKLLKTKTFRSGNVLLYYQPIKKQEEYSTMKDKQDSQPESDLPEKLGQPAYRALAGVGIQRLEQLTRFGEVEIKKLHGIGPNALGKLRAALAAKGLSFADPKGG